jgi:large subunit ribosomal protein L25
VECLPADIPEHIDVDVTNLDVHGSIRLRDVATDAKWKLVTDGDTMLVHVVVPKAEEAAVAATEAAPAAAGSEPEVIKKGKTDKEDDEKDKKDKK